MAAPGAQEQAAAAAAANPSVCAAESWRRACPASCSRRVARCSKNDRRRSPVRAVRKKERVVVSVLPEVCLFCLFHDGFVFLVASSLPQPAHLMYENNLGGLGVRLLPTLRCGAPTKPWNVHYWLLHSTAMSFPPRPRTVHQRI